VPATAESIARIIHSLAGGSDPFAILGGRDEQTYMQTLWTPHGYQLEYQEGSTAQHYHCTREDLSAETIVEVFCDYLAGDIHWKRAEISIRVP
jgi:hypothetical protein